MSLSRILNDDPPPVVRAPPVSTSSPAAAVQTANSGPGGAPRHHDGVLRDPMSRDTGLARQSPRLASQQHLLQQALSYDTQHNVGRDDVGGRMGHSPHALSPHDGDGGGGNHHPRHYASLPPSQHHDHWEREHESLQAHQQPGTSSSWNPYTTSSGRQSSREYQQLDHHSTASSPRDYPISSRMSNTRQIENAMSPQQQHQYVHPVSALQVDYGRQVPPTSPASYPQQFPSERQQPSDYQLHPSTGLSPRFLPQQQHPERRKRKRSIEQSPPAEQLSSRKVSRRSEIQHSTLSPIGVEPSSSSSHGISTAFATTQSAASPAGRDPYSHPLDPSSGRHRRHSSHSQALSPLEQYPQPPNSPSVASGLHEAWSDEDGRSSHMNKSSSAARIDEHRGSEPWGEAQTSETDVDPLWAATRQHQYIQQQQQLQQRQIPPMDPPFPSVNGHSQRPHTPYQRETHGHAYDEYPVSPRHQYAQSQQSYRNEDAWQAGPPASSHREHGDGVVLSTSSEPVRGRPSTDSRSYAQHQGRRSISGSPTGVAPNQGRKPLAGPPSPAPPQPFSTTPYPSSQSLNQSLVGIGQGRPHGQGQVQLHSSRRMSLGTIYANDTVSESNYYAATTNRRVSTATTIEGSPPQGSDSHGTSGQRPSHEYTPSPPPTMSRVLAPNASSGLAAAASTGSVTATSSGSVKKKRSRRPNPKPISLGQVAPGDVSTPEAANTAGSAAMIMRGSSSDDSPAADGSQRSLEDAPAAQVPSVLNDKYASARIELIARELSNQEALSSTSTPTAARSRSRKKKLTVIGPDASAASSQMQEKGPSPHHHQVKQEEQSVTLGADDDAWGTLGAGIGAGQGADEAAEELERLTDGESHPSPSKYDSVTIGAAHQLERSASYQNGFAVTEPPAPLPPRKRKRGGTDGSAPKVPRKRKGAAAIAAAAAAAAAFLEEAESNEPNANHPGHPALEESLGTELANGSLLPENGDIAAQSNISLAPKKGAAPKKISEPVVLARRLIQLEDLQRKIWINLARKDIPRVYRHVTSGYTHKVTHHKKLSSMIMSNARRATTRTSKLAKDNQIKARRITREMLLYWKRNEKEEGVSRRRAEKEALDKVKAEEERKEAVRHAKKLEFLLTQTELFSHFVGSKLKTAELEKDPAAKEDGSTLPSTPAIDITAANEDGLEELDFDRDDQDNLNRHAALRAREHVMTARARAKQFDVNAASEREKNEALVKSRSLSDTPDPEVSKRTAPVINFDSDEFNFQNPTSMAGVEQIEQPKMLAITLKDYQLKGLRWLASLYEQGINGILADEMGLGKTVQSISVLAYLIERHDIWGPFLVIAPASTLFNWQQELARFVPDVKALPYWGNPKERALLRKFWSKKEISYNEDTPFNVLITSYQMVVQDAQYFQRVKWQYMILDEAQAIKSSSSARWKTLLGFSCRNRLLLTGTPIQNSMHELWALLHFIMPTLFDSHDEFMEWFSKDIESHAENKGENNVNEHQIKRLHMILKPFMLRRVKKNVQNELGDKIEIDLACDLSPRQRTLYRGLRANVSVADLLVKASRQGDADSARSLMNLVMQFRKVCNHPDLFQRAEVITPYAFCAFAKSNITREKDVLFYPDIAKNPISLSLPRMFIEEGTLCGVPGESSFGTDSNILGSMMNIWLTDYIARSTTSSFSFLSLLDISPREAHHFFHKSLLLRLMSAVHGDNLFSELAPFSRHSEFAANSLLPKWQIRFPVLSSDLDVAEDLPPLSEIGNRYWQASCLSRPLITSCRIPLVVAPPIQVHVSDRSFIEAQARVSGAGDFEYLALFGLPPRLENSVEAYDELLKHVPVIPPRGLLSASGLDQLPRSPTIVPEPQSLISDSAKLARLDSLLDKLKPGGHRVLIYFQMTRMIDLMEEYMSFRKHKYLRLDGSSKLEDRRDMVIEWQTNPDIFVFLLSTRAGGLGINLTAADTVIFYDHDWNPSNDSQAMDRAHRLGQTRQVTVYRLITKGTIDERIVQLARVKKDVQDIVVGNRQFADGARTNDIASLLLNDDELETLNVGPDASSIPNGEQEIKTAQDVARMWRDEGDDFFGNQPSAQAALDAEVNEDIPTGASTPLPPPKNKRKPRGSNKKKVTGAAVLGDNLPEDL